MPEAFAKLWNVSTSSADAVSSRRVIELPRAGGGLTDLPALPEMATFMCSNDVEAGGQTVRSVLNRVASARIAYLDSCYTKLGLPPQLAKTYAVLAYAAYRGLLQLAHEAPEALPADWSSYAEVVRLALIPVENGPPRRGRITT